MLKVETFREIFQAIRKWWQSVAVVRTGAGVGTESVTECATGQEVMSGVENETEEEGMEERTASPGRYQQLMKAIDHFMKQHYELRHNLLVGDVEFRRCAEPDSQFLPIDKRAMNSIAIEAHTVGIPLWDRDLNRYVYSDCVPLYNPLEEYLDNLPAWDGSDRIDALAATVPCRNPHWQGLFHRWFLSMVAHWQGRLDDKKYANHVSPLLVGEQGTRKSTFCRNLLPPELRAYYTDSIDFGRKRDAEIYLTRFALINIDEFDQVSSTQQVFLKHILQKPVVNLRKPYAAAVLEMRRYASFIGTSNQKELLTDPTGSRRFICIEVTGGINTDQPIEYRQLYAQALHEINAGIRYWFDREEERLMTEANREFEQVTMEEQLFYRYFRPANEGEKQAEWLSPAEILNIMRRNSAIPLSQKRVSVFGRMLQKHGVRSKRVERGTVYYVVANE